MVSELFANAILYTTSGHSGGLVTVSIAISRGMARIHVIDQGASLELGQAAPSTAAAAAAAPRLGAGLTIVRQLADEFVTEGPDKCFTLRVAGPVRPSLSDGPGGSELEHERRGGHPMKDPHIHAEKTTAAGIRAAGHEGADRRGPRRGPGPAKDGQYRLRSPAVIPFDQHQSRNRSPARPAVIGCAASACSWRTPPPASSSCQRRSPGRVMPTAEELQAEELTYRALAARLG